MIKKIKWKEGIPEQKTEKGDDNSHWPGNQFTLLLNSHAFIPLSVKASESTAPTAIYFRVLILLLKCIFSRTLLCSMAARRGKREIRSDSRNTSGDRRGGFGVGFGLALELRGWHCHRRSGNDWPFLSLYLGPSSRYGYRLKCELKIITPLAKVHAGRCA